MLSELRLKIMLSSGMHFCKPLGERVTPVLRQSSQTQSFHAEMSTVMVSTEGNFTNSPYFQNIVQQNVPYNEGSCGINSLRPPKFLGIFTDNMAYEASKHTKPHLYAT